MESSTTESIAPYSFIFSSQPQPASSSWVTGLEQGHPGSVPLRRCRYSALRCAACANDQSSDKKLAITAAASLPQSRGRVTWCLHGFAGHHVGAAERRRSGSDYWLLTIDRPDRMPLVICTWVNCIVVWRWLWHHASDLDKPETDRQDFQSTKTREMRVVTSFLRRRGVVLRKYGMRRLLRSRNRARAGAHRLPYTTPPTPNCAVGRWSSIAPIWRQFRNHAKELTTVKRNSVSQRCLPAAYESALSLGHCSILCITSPTRRVSQCTLLLSRPNCWLSNVTQFTYYQHLL